MTVRLSGSEIYTQVSSKRTRDALERLGESLEGV
jgi:hypothetical protein